MTIITRFDNAQEALKMLSQNTELLLTGKRKIADVKEVNNTIGKANAIVKNQSAELVRLADKNSEIPWLNISTRSKND